MDGLRRGDPYRKGAEQQAGRPQPHVDSSVVLLLRQSFHHLVLHKREHDIVEAARQPANEEPHRILDGAGLEVEAQGAYDASEDEVVKIVVAGAVEANQVVDVDCRHHVRRVQVEAAAYALCMRQRARAASATS